MRNIKREYAVRAAKNYAFKIEVPWEKWGKLTHDQQKQVRELSRVTLIRTLNEFLKKEEV